MKRRLLNVLKAHWRGTHRALETALRRVLRGRSRGELLHLARRPALAGLLLAGALVGTEPAHADVVELSDIASSENLGGFAIPGAAEDDRSGYSVAAAGDVNGDGIPDLIVGAPSAAPNGAISGSTYVVFGTAAGAIVDLVDVENGIGGFAIHGAAEHDRSGFSVAGAGDVNGDGLDDIIIGAPESSVTNTRAGSAYVVFGKSDGASIDLGDIESGTGGFAIHGVTQSDLAGKSVSGAGDVNGDGYADIIVGAPDYGNAGAAYVVFGKTSGTAVNLDDIAAGNGGFAMFGDSNGDYAGFSVSGGGDVNGDGIPDIIVGAYAATPNGTWSGKAYVVFGKSNGAAIDLADVENGTGGFAMIGSTAFHRTGDRVSNAGDVNGDGLADVLVSARGASPNGAVSGMAYVVFGKSDGTAVDLADVANGAGGFAMLGAAADDVAGTGASGAGDVNGDGLADVIVGAYRADPNGSSSGASYVVFGKADGTAVELADVAVGTTGITLNGVAGGDNSGFSASRAGDVNRDGLADVIVGAFGAGNSSGSSYVVFSDQTPESNPAYFAYTRPGDGPGGEIVPPTDFQDARLKVDFSDDDSGDNGSAGASLEMAGLYRSGSVVTNLTDTGPTTAMADAAWEFMTDRVNWTDAEITLKYTDDELGGLLSAEEQLTVFAAAALEGPWTVLPPDVDADRNEIAVTIQPGANPRFFAVALAMDILWVNFGHEGDQLGIREFPLASLQEAVDSVNAGGTINIDGDSTVTNTLNPITISKPVTIQAVDGPVTIGSP